MSKVTHERCRYDFFGERTDLLRCQIAPDHRVLLLAERRVKVLQELNTLGMLVGEAKMEAEKYAWA